MLYVSTHLHSPATGSSGGRIVRLGGWCSRVCEPSRAGAIALSGVRIGALGGARGLGVVWVAHPLRCALLACSGRGMLLGVEDRQPGRRGWRAGGGGSRSCRGCRISREPHAPGRRRCSVPPLRRVWCLLRASGCAVSIVPSDGVAGPIPGRRSSLVGAARRISSSSDGRVVPTSLGRCVTGAFLRSR